MRLYIGIFSIEETAYALNGELFYLVNHLTSPVVPCSGVSFRIFVGADGAECLQHLVADIVLGGDEFNAHRLSFFLFLNQIENLQILFHRK